MDNVVNDIVVSISTLLDDIFADLQGAAGALIGISTTIAGIGCIIYIASIILPSIERGERIYFYPLLKPIVVALVVVNFGVVADGLSSLSTGLGSAISKVVSEEDSFSNFELFAEKVNEMCDKELLAEETSKQMTETPTQGATTTETSGEVDDTVEKGMSWWSKAGATIFYKWLIPALSWLAQMIGQIIYIGMLLYSKFVLLILTIVGPLSFALSQFKVFSGSFSQWLARFISISLYPALCSLIRGVVDQITKAIALNMHLSLSGVLISIFLLIFSATLYLHVPTLADFIVQSGGAGNVGGFAKSALSKITGR